MEEGEYYDKEEFEQYHEEINFGINPKNRFSETKYYLAKMFVFVFLLSNIRNTIRSVIATSIMETMIDNAACNACVDLKHCT